jgi:hypothetical protein
MKSACAEGLRNTRFSGTTSVGSSFREKFPEKVT